MLRTTTSARQSGLVKSPLNVPPKPKPQGNPQEESGFTCSTRLCKKSTHWRAGVRVTKIREVKLCVELWKYIVVSTIRRVMALSPSLRVRLAVQAY